VKNTWKEFRKYIGVDIYGKCGDRNFLCPRHGTYFSDPQCNKMIESTYKFYLKFENSICKDYVTDNFFIDLYMVPIVYGGVDYTQQSAAQFLHRHSKFKDEKVGRLSENTRRRKPSIQRILLVEGSLSC
jgi:hypothetical protein